MPRDQDELIAQVYLGAQYGNPPARSSPSMQLAAFDRVFLGAGESKRIMLHVRPRQLQYWSSVENKWLTPAGSRTVFVGGSSRDLPLQASAQ